MTTKDTSLPSVIDAVEFRRDQYGLTQRDWAKIIGISQSHYSEFVSGRRKLTVAQSAKCYEFGVPADCLFQCKPIKNLLQIAQVLKERT